MYDSLMLKISGPNKRIDFSHTPIHINRGKIAPPLIFRLESF